MIVNDFGSINIDLLLITAETDRTMELTNGCICCSMEGGELEETLVAALAVKPDVVIIEASGVAEPKDLARLVILSPNQQVGYGGLVYVLDALHYEETLKKHRRITEHIALADLVVLTKTEHIADAAKERVMQKVSKKTKRPIVPVRCGELSPELLFDIPERVEVQPSLLQQHEVHAHRHLHDEYQSVTFIESQPLHPEKLKAFMNHPPRGIYRIKGWVYFGMAGYEQKFVIQSVGGRWDMYAEEWNGDEVPQTTLVLIGTNFDEDEARGALRHTIGPSDEMIDIRRYSR